MASWSTLTWKSRTSRFQADHAHFWRLHTITLAEDVLLLPQPCSNKAFFWEFFLVLRLLNRWLSIFFLLIGLFESTLVFASFFWNIWL